MKYNTDKIDISVTGADFARFQQQHAKLEKAKQLGHVYYMFVDGHPDFSYIAEHGWSIIAESDEEAIEKAYEDVWFLYAVEDDTLMERF